MTERIGTSALLLSLLILFFPDPGGAQQVSSTVPASSGAIEGVIFDSIAGAPLDEADVVLWNTSYRTTTDSDGEFVLERIPAGEYSAVFYHPRLMRLGISTGTSTVEVEADETTTIRLTTPSMVTVQQTQCALEEDPGDIRGLATGKVSDPETGVSLPGAEVTLTWTDASGEEFERTTVETDEQGWYRFCRVPFERVVGARARFFHRQGPRREFTLANRKNIRVDFIVADAEPASVTGKVLDSDTEEPVSDAEVQLLGTSFRKTTNNSGRFRFKDVAPGVYTVEVSHLTFGTRADTVQIGSGLDVQLEVPVSTKPIEVDPIVVAAEARPVERAVSRGGTVITREQVDAVRHRSRDAADIIRAQGEGGVIVKRHQAGLCVGFSQGQARMMKSDCQPANLYVDDVRMTVPEIAMDIPAEAVDRVILYRPVQAGNLFGLGSGNGVIQIYTRSADPRWRNPR